MTASDLTNSQIIVLLKAPYIIGFDPTELREELRRRNRAAFAADVARRTSNTSVATPP